MWADAARRIAFNLEEAISIDGVDGSCSRHLVAPRWGLIVLNGERSTLSIELAFSKLKAILRRAATRTIPELWNTIGQALPQFSPTECANYFTACGCEPE